MTAYLDLFTQTIAQCLVEESFVAKQKKTVVNNDTYFDDDDVDEYVSIGASNTALMGMIHGACVWNTSRYATSTGHLSLLLRWLSIR